MHFSKLKCHEDDIKYFYNKIFLKSLANIKLRQINDDSLVMDMSGNKNI